MGKRDIKLSVDILLCQGPIIASYLFTTFTTKAREVE